MPKKTERRSRRRQAHYAKKAGKPPGSILHLGDVKVAKPDITLFDYDATRLTEITFSTVEESRSYLRQHEKLWLNVHGVHEPHIMEEIGARFRLHPLVLEDIANTHQRPKVEDYGDYIYVVLRAFSYDRENADVSSDQISLILGPHFVLSFQERGTGLFAPIRERLRKEGGHLRKNGTDALLHALIDSVVDRYFVVVEELADDIDALEDEVIQGRGKHVVERINHFKHECQVLRRAIWPMREALYNLLRHPGELVGKGMELYFRDVHDHCTHILDQLDALRDQTGGLLDIHLTAASNRLNAELRVLTVVTTLFSPAMLVTGFFGMNFDQMPLLKHHDGWIISLLMIAAGGGLLLIALYWRRWWVRDKL